MSTPIRSVKFWLNAFIPRDVLGYTLVVPAGPHHGLTMIPGPNPLSDCFLTDQRSFDSALTAKSRMHSEFTIDFTSARPALTQSHNCDPTTELDCGDGDVECTSRGDTSRMSFTMLPPPGAGKAAIEMKCAASNPCAPTSRLFGDIDYVGRILIDLSARSLKFDGMIDRFPAFEAYASINGGVAFALFTIAPPAGNTVMNLPGGADSPVRVRIADRNGDGIFDTLTKF